MNNLEEATQLIAKAFSMIGSGSGNTHNKAPAAFQTSNGLYGDGGLWTATGADKDVFTAYVRPNTGIQSVLPLLPTTTTNLTWWTITGIQSDNTSIPVNVCDPAPAGFVQGCALTTQFARQRWDTQTIDADRVAEVDNMGVTTDLNLVGRLLQNDHLTPSDIARDPSLKLNVVTVMEMTNAAMLFQRGDQNMLGLSRMLWQGDPTNNSSGGGYKEFPGFDLQVQTGQIDAYTGIACEALDADIKDFGYQQVNLSGLNDIARYVSAMEFYLTTFADDSGMGPINYAICMTPGLWQELSNVWPILYNTNSAANILTGNTRLVNGGIELIRMRDEMRQGKFIDINGSRYNVITDSGIFESNSANDGNLAAGEFASSIYFIPLTVRGNFPVTFMQHYDYRTWGRDVSLLRGNEEFWTDRGVFSWAFDGNLWCYKLALKSELRLIVRTPQFAGRIDNVKYVPMQHERTNTPGGPYTLNGGVSSRVGLDLQAVWK